MLISGGSSDDERREKVKEIVRKLSETESDSLIRTILEEFDKTYPSYQGPFPYDFFSYFWASQFGIISAYRDLDDQLDRVMTIVESKVSLNYEVKRSQTGQRRPKANIKVKMDTATKQRLEQAAAAEGSDLLSYIRKHLEHLRQSGQISTAEDTINAPKESKVESVEIKCKSGLPPLEELVELGLNYVDRTINQNEELKKICEQDNYPNANYIHQLLHSFWVERFRDEIGEQGLYHDPFTSIKLGKAEEEIAKRWKARALFNGPQWVTPGAPIPRGIPGDINNDGKVSLQDLVMLANVYGSKPGDSNWNPNADINGDGKVSLQDLVVLANHYGQHYP